MKVLSVGRGLCVDVDNGRVDFGVERGVDGALVADGFGAFAHFKWDGFREGDSDGKAGDSAGRRGFAHVLFDDGGCAGDVEILAFGPHGDSGEDAAC